MRKRTTVPLDIRWARELAYVSDLAYVAPAVMEDAIRTELGYPQFEFFDIERTECCVMADDSNVVVSFRGTELLELSDWITDLDFDLVPGPLDGDVHEGFYDALSNVWHLVDRTVGDFDPGGTKSLTVTGHSLGGALATLAVARWLDEGRPVTGLYTFGQPRVGDGNFARNFDFHFKPYAFRFVNNNDIITRVPPRRYGYRHIGRFRYFTEPGVLETDISWWRFFLDNIKGQVEDIWEWGADGIKDHSMTAYMQMFDLNLPKRLFVPRQPTKASLIQPRRRAA